MAAEKSGISVHFLVTDDHAFFKTFVKLEVAERVLRNEVKAILEIGRVVECQAGSKKMRYTVFCYIICFNQLKLPICSATG